MEEKKKYPVFRNPDEYMKNRERRNPLGLIKIRGEYRALDRCLKDVPGIHTVCDAPSGPGRTFPYWKKKDYKVHAVDISERMVAASRKAHKAAGIPGKVEMGDIFSLNKILEEKPDLVACIRFIYYFNAEDRARLLRVLADASRRYVLVQYKTTETIKGQITLSRRMSEEKNPKKSHLEQRAVSFDGIIKELKEAGLNPHKIEPIGEFSDRVFVLAEKSDTGGLQAAGSKNSGVIFKKPRRLYLAAALLVIFALAYFLNSDRIFFSENEALLSLGARSVLNGDWVAPRIYDNIFSGTPTLMFWWIAAVSAPFSEVTERSARFACILLMLGALYSIYAFSSRQGRSAGGILTILILGTCYMFWENAGGVDTDMMLTISLTVAWGALFTLLNDSFRSKYWRLLWGGLSIGLFLIGPFALALTGVLFTIYAFSSWNPGEIWKRFLQIRLFSGILLCLAPFLLWTVSAYFRYGIGPVKQIFYNRHLITLSNFIDRPERSLHDYLSEYPMNLLPWVLLLSFVAWRLLKQRAVKSESSSAINKFALCACATIFIFFSFINPSGYHLLPLTPWVAFLIADLLLNRLLALVPFDPNYKSQERMLLGRLLGTESGRIYVGMAVFLIAGTALYNGAVAHYREGYDSPRSAAREIDRNANANERLILIDNTDPRIIFYITKEFEISDDGDAAMQNLQKMLTSDQQMDLVVDGNDLFKFQKLRNPGIYVEAKIIFQDKVYYILTNEFRPGAVPLSSLTFRRPA
jgi:4-amino-4-deoxy-L-arabinose transferase-like glycosyltransferase